MVECAVGGWNKHKNRVKQGGIMTEELARYEARNPAITKDFLTTETSPAALMQLVLSRGGNLDKLEKMLELQERWEKNEARKAFYEDFAKFKTVAPPLKKDQYNKFFESWYTSLGKLLDTYNPVLAQYGLTLTFLPTEQNEKTMTVTAVLSHRLGHRESVPMTGPIDVAATGKVSGQKSRNALQDVKSTFTYLRSAAAEAILGVAGTEATHDDDGNSAGEIDFVSPEQVKEMTSMITAKNVYLPKFLSYMNAETVDTILAKDIKKAMSVLNKAKATQKPERQPGEE